MRLLRLFLVPLIFVFFFSFAHASTDLIIHVDSSGKAIFLGSTTENISSFLPEGIYVENLKIKGETIFQTSKIGAVWNFSYSLPNSNIEVFLPPGSKIKNTSGEVLVDGGSLAVYSENNISVEYTIEENSSSFNFIWILIGIFVVLGVIYFFIKKKKMEPIKNKNKEERGKEKLEVFQEILSERENKIINTLKEKGKIKSSYLRRLTDLPKATFSRHIQELEKKGIIKRSGEGRNKFVEFSK